MGKPLSVLIVEDSASDAGLIVRQLQKDGFDVFHSRVETAAEMRNSLQAQAWDAVLSDFKVPGFGADPALALLRDMNIDIPFIVVSAVIGEEAAVGLMKAGAHDYIMKNQLGRLAPAVTREVAEAHDRLARRQADKALKESEARYRSLFENMLNGFAYCRMEYDHEDRPVDFVYLDVNNALQRLTGLKDVVGKKVTEVIPGIRELSPELFETYGRVARTGVPETFEFDFKSLGQWLTISVYSPETGYFVAVFDDITPRKKAELALRESEEKYRGIYDNLQDVYVETNLDGTIVEISPKVELLLNSQYRREELIGKRASDLYVDPRRREDILQALNQHGRIIDFEVDLRNRDGSIVPCSISAMLLFSAEGQPTGIVATLRNIAQRKRAEREIAEANVQFQAMVEQSIVGIIIIQDGRFSYVNPHFCEIHGYAMQHKLIGMDPVSLIVEKDRPATMETIRRLLGGEVAHVRHNLTSLRKDGTTVELEVNSARASYRGRPAIIAMVQDISDKKRAEDEVQRYVVQLRTAILQTVEVATTLSEMRDPYTAGHERRVAQIAVAIGTELGLDAHQLEGLRIAGYLHDIGKIVIPAEILAKPGKLSPIEYKMVQGHPQASYDTLKNVHFPWPVAQVALQHHERLDGSGYPQGLKGEAILLESRIMAVADTIEAMSAHRPYRAALEIESALAEIERGRGTKFDPAVADACLRLFHEKGYTLPA